MLLLCLPIFCLAGSVRHEGTPQTGNVDISVKESMEEIEETSEADGLAQVRQERREIPISFPFYGEQERHRLTLAAPEEGQNAYELLHYDENGKIIQQIFCGKLTEPVTFSFDGLAYASWYDL